MKPEGCTCTFRDLNPLCPRHGDPRDTSIAHVLPGDVLLPPPSTDPDVIRLIFTVRLDREGMRRYLLEYPGFAEEGESAFDTLAREAIAAWDMEGLIDGEPEVRNA